MEITALILFVGFIILFSINWKKKTKRTTKPLPPDYRIILQENVTFYQNLNETDKLQFETRLQNFLDAVKITGVKTVVEPIDKALVAASAIIPIFAFKNWEYNNLNEVLLYPDSFNEEFNTNGDQERFVLGMVGSGAMQHVMILSQPALRQGFINKTDKNNTGIHEFVHLIDKTDGEVDGVPEYLMNKQYLLPWINLMHKNIKEILADKSDINPYGATNKAEFFAVVSEYFFERPDLLRIKHPELYKLLEQVFSNDSNTKTKKKL
jgi:Mlc titration factor MtfA (ptsG expression regulator)